jgi:hypothetical protein
LADIIVQGIAVYVFRQLRKYGDRFRFQVHFLKIGIQVAVQRQDGPVGSFPGYIEHIAGVDQLVFQRVRYDPIQFAPARIEAGFFPGNRCRAAVG